MEAMGNRHDDHDAMIITTVTVKRWRGQDRGKGILQCRLPSQTSLCRFWAHASTTDLVSQLRETSRERLCAQNKIALSNDQVETFKVTDSIDFTM